MGTGTGERVHLGQPSRRGTRSRFALTGPSRSYDPTTVAIRPDLADIAVADTHFAPHYAEPVERRIGAKGATLREGPGEDAAAVTPLAADDCFALLDLTGGWAWGYECGSHRVGYVRADELAD